MRDKTAKNLGPFEYSKNEQKYMNDTGEKLLPAHSSEQTNSAVTTLSVFFTEQEYRCCVGFVRMRFIVLDHRSDLRLHIADMQVEKSI